MFPAIVLAVPLVLSGCAGDASALDPAGPDARAIARLWWVMFYASIVLFALVMGLFALVMLKPGAGARLPEGRWILWGGLWMPVPVLMALLVVSLVQGEHLLAREGSGDALRVEAHARQWQWEFRYLDAENRPVTVDVLHMPVDRPVEVVTTSEDVIHSLWVPVLGGKIDAVPGHRNRVRLLADKTGNFGGLCAEYCGTGHTNMRFRVLVHEPEAFRALLERGFVE
ncbi:cytochrome c oxidase subunit II [Aquibium carbonis]|uniref:cytochrome c oxidase subunit II n=1 Tax=Aquibium carbonis TaxID=2495581 RepID=UPI001FDF37E4|nr:cytochrome c oxidase subunit II [Aquibium carbonis]